MDSLTRNDEINLLYVASTRAMQTLVYNAIINTIAREYYEKRQAEKKLTQAEC